MKPSKYILVHGPHAQNSLKRVLQSQRPAGFLASIMFSGQGVGGPAPISIGIWDLGAWLGGLIRLVETLNSTQRTFVFFEVKAAVPSGLISRPERIMSWLRDALGREVTPSEKESLQNNLIANDYFAMAEVIRCDLGIDYLVGITPSMVAGENEGSYYLNHFSTFEGQLILASTYELREFAERTGRSFESFLAVVIVAQVLVARFYPDLGFHMEDRGCLFDYNEDRVSIQRKVQNPLIEQACMRAISPPYHPAVESLVKALRGLQ